MDYIKPAEVVKSMVAAGATKGALSVKGPARARFFLQGRARGAARGGPLTRLDTAFSRDQDFKIYVQHRMTEHGAELWKWLEAGAHFYVCGDASRMAKDVDKALHQIIETNGGLTSEAANEYVQKLKGQKRYQRDVY
jgi:sulfite reductase (NADPH) flavoprotein alpha-component